MERMMKKKLDREDKKFIAPRFPGGVVKPGDLRKIADVCEKFPESKIKLTGEIIVGGISDGKRNDEFREMLGLSTFSIAGFSVRPVRICAGGYTCDNNLGDSFPLGLKLDGLFSGRKLPFKLIISVSGCSRSCAEPAIRDIGIVASSKGYAIFVGGAAGARPKIGEKLIENASEHEVIDILEKIIDLYQKDAKTPERLGIFIERIGLERFKKAVITSSPSVEKI
jgi:NAD(P)H-nitrite reductase large subunit